MVAPEHTIGVVTGMAYGNETADANNVNVSANGDLVLLSPCLENFTGVSTFDLYHWLVSANVINPFLASSYAEFFYHDCIGLQLTTLPQQYFTNRWSQHSQVVDCSVSSLQYYCEVYYASGEGYQNAQAVLMYNHRKL